MYFWFFAFFFTGPRRSYLTGPRRKGWTETEIIALKAGVKRHGIGNWVDVLRDRDFGPHLRGAHYGTCGVGISRTTILENHEIIATHISQKNLRVISFQTTARSYKHQLEGQMASPKGNCFIYLLLFFLLFYFILFICVCVCVCVVQQQQQKVT